MKTLTYGLVLLGFLGAVSGASAQESEGLEVSEFDSASDINFLEESVQSEPMTVQLAAPQATAAVTVQTSQVQKQPTVNIEDYEIEQKSKDSLRQLHEEIYKTNDAVITEINKSRIDEENRRRDKFLGRVGSAETEAQAPAPAIQVIQQESLLDKESALESRISALEVTKSAEVAVVPDKTYFQAILGFTEIPDAINIKSDAAMGFGLGVKVRDRMLVEGNFIYSSFLKDYPVETNIEQYSGVGNLKYQMFQGMLRPVIGASVAYTYRTYEDTYFSSGESVSSNAIDWGMLGGVDIELSEGFSIGAEFRYMWNLTNKTDGSYPYMGGEKPLDDFNYYVMSLSGRFIF